MLNLILKDLIIQKKNIAFVLIYAALGFFLFKSFEYGVFSIIVVAVVYIISQGAFWIDEKNNGDFMLNSLPVNRKTVVVAKYVSIYLYYFASVLIYILVYYINDLFLHIVQTSSVYLKPEVFVAGLLCAIIMSSISYPIYFKFGVTKSKFVMFILFFVFFAFSGAIPKIVNLEKLNFTNGNLFMVLCIVVCFLIHYLSYLLAYNVYKRKDL